MFCGDSVVRVLRYLGYDVAHVRNYTDVGHLTSDADTGEDKMAKGARRENLSPIEIANKYISIFEHDTAAINLSEPTVKPRATEYVEEMIGMVEVLLEKGYAYATDLAIYFDVSKAKDYTVLSGQNLEELIDGAGTGEITDSQKRNQIDFVLWFFKAGTHKNTLQYWKSPFTSPLVENGEGFPGWHIECSAMSKKNLGETIDLHMGGVEHIPIHHPNEIAQSESANGCQFVRYWIHNEHLLVNDRKMAKSEGTGIIVAEIEERGIDPLALRYFFLQAHYRSKQNFTWEALQGAAQGLERLRGRVRAVAGEKGSVSDAYKERFDAAIADDFNVPEAFAITHELLKSDLSKKDKYATVISFDEVLGLQLADLREEAEEEAPAEVQKLLQEREQLRAHKQFIQADAIRDKIEQLGYEVYDTGDGAKVKKK
jgi:cysteinyl-tRNA synthetase